jgi:hypothetical protein
VLIRTGVIAVMSHAAEKAYAASALHTIEKINSCLLVIFLVMRKKLMTEA